ncbi:hypothetical protein ACFL0M_15130 [Thermodesulfobacteriota bacterium]
MARYNLQANNKMMMKTKRQPFKWFCILLIAGWSFAGDVCADGLFKDRRIHLRIDANSIFSAGVTGTTAGYNYIALIENAKQESISLGNLGYWEQVDDLPSFLRNYDLQLIIKNQAKGKFKIEFEYDRQQQDIIYRISEGKIQVKLDNTEYYPALIIEDVTPVAKKVDEDRLPKDAKRVLFFDFNNFDVDLRSYYGSVKRLLKNPDYSHYFYYYEASNYNGYYFKTYQNAAKLDTDKMGLSLENGTREYYQKVLDNLKSRLGTDFADQVIIVSRFGKKFSEELKKYAHEIGMSPDMVITLWSYDDIKQIKP